MTDIMCYAYPVINPHHMTDVICNLYHMAEVIGCLQSASLVIKLTELAIPI